VNILQLVPRIPAPLVDGGAIYVYNTALELSKLGNRVTIAALHSNRHEQDVDQISRFATLYTKDGKFQAYTPGAAIKSLVTGQPITVQHRMDPAIINQLISSVEEDIDVILIEGIHISGAISKIREKFPGVPIVLRQSNVEFEVLSTVGEQMKNPLKKGFYKLQSRFMKAFELERMRKCDAVSFISTSDLKTFQPYFSDLRYFISNAGAYLPEITEGRKTNKLVAISNWEWQPNIQGLEWFLKNVWGEVREKYPVLSFHIAGKGISAAFKQQFAGDRLIFEGFVDDIEQYRQQATLFVAPLFSGSGMKLKILEAFASGLPTITTNIGIQGIEARPGIHYMQAENKEEFISAIGNLITHRDRRDAIGSNARELIKEHYTWPVLAEKLHRFLMKLTNAS